MTVQHFAQARIENDALGSQPLTQQLISIAQPGVAMGISSLPAALVVRMQDKWACPRALRLLTAPGQAEELAPAASQERVFGQRTYT